MKKALLVVALIGSMVASADTDSYLYWMVSASAPSYSYAKIRYLTPTDGYLTSYAAPDPTAYSFGSQVSSSDIADQRDTWNDGLYAAVDSSKLPTTFIVELWNSSGFVGQQAISSESLASYIYSGGMSLPPSTPALFSSFSIPEPSSGLLMLVGCALLGLRRRKQKNA